MRDHSLTQCDICYLTDLMIISLPPAAEHLRRLWEQTGCSTVLSTVAPKLCDVLSYSVEREQWGKAANRNDLPLCSLRTVMHDWGGGVVRKLLVDTATGITLRVRFQPLINKEPIMRRLKYTEQKKENWSLFCFFLNLCPRWPLWQKNQQVLRVIFGCLTSVKLSWMPFLHYKRLCFGNHYAVLFGERHTLLFCRINEPKWYFIQSDICRANIKKKTKAHQQAKKHKISTFTL